jgi:hypothetical protein
MMAYVLYPPQTGDTIVSAKLDFKEMVMLTGLATMDSLIPSPWAPRVKKDVPTLMSVTPMPITVFRRHRSAMMFILTRVNLFVLTLLQFDHVSRKVTVHEDTVATKQMQLHTIHALTTMNVTSGILIVPSTRIV